MNVFTFWLALQSPPPPRAAIAFGHTTHIKGPGSLAGVAEVNTDKLKFAFAEKSATGNVARAAQTAPSRVLLNSILVNQISTQLGTVRSLLNARPSPQGPREFVRPDG